MQNKPNFQNAKNVLTLVDTRNYNELWVVDYYAKQTQSNPTSVNFSLKFWIFNLKLLILSVDMKRTYEKNVASTLMSLDMLWSTLDILWTIVGVSLECFGHTLDDLGWPWITSVYKNENYEDFFLSRCNFSFSCSKLGFLTGGGTALNFSSSKLGLLKSLVSSFLAGGFWTCCWSLNDQKASFRGAVLASKLSEAKP